MDTRPRGVMVGFRLYHVANLQLCAVSKRTQRAEGSMRMWTTFDGSRAPPTPKKNGLRTGSAGQFPTNADWRSPRNQELTAATDHRLLRWVTGCLASLL